MNQKTVAFHHFGCKVNFAEASSLSRQLKESGYVLKDFHEQADVYVISTCVVTAVAEKKCRAAVRQAHKLNPHAKIAVIGCFAELKPGELKMMEGVDIVLGHEGKFNLPGELEKLESDTPYHGGFATAAKPEKGSFVPSWSYGDRTRSFLKIQDGCDYFCTYCTIPLARGRSRSDTIAHVVQSASEIAANGIREIILTGVNIGDFGRSHGESFLQLLQALEEGANVSRIRISSIEPDLLSDEIIAFVASSRKFLPHFHIPLQSGCNNTLKAMHRRYTRELYASRVARIKSLMPDACIAADVIVGFPGETAENFAETTRFIENLDVSYLHVFTYSERENTLAAKMDSHVHDREKKRRSDLLHRISDEKKSLFYTNNAGKMASVLFESDNSAGFMHGFTENYIKVKTPFQPEMINQVVPVQLVSCDEDGMYRVTIYPETQNLHQQNLPHEPSGADTTGMLPHPRNR